MKIAVKQHTLVPAGLFELSVHIYYTISPVHKEAEQNSNCNNISVQTD
jgi:hypothetical protein